MNEYTGTVLYVSHDRYFINQTATRILELTNHTLVNYIGNYDYYMEKKEELTRAYASSPADNGQDRKAVGADGTGLAGFASSDSERPGSAAAGQMVPGENGARSTDSNGSGKMDWKAQKEEQARLRKKENRIRKIEEEIEKLEARNKEIDEEFLKPETGTDLPKCQELAKEQNENNDRLQELYEDWETASDED